jgi:DNA-cytosine methyltransferase
VIIETGNEPKNASKNVVENNLIERSDTEYTTDALKTTIQRNKNVIPKRNLLIATDCSGMESPVFALKKIGVKLKHLWSCDTDKFCKRISIDNCAPKHFFDDITQMDAIRKCFPPPLKLDIYVVGVPCVPYSNLAFHKKKKNRQKKIDSNSLLFDSVFDTIRCVRPKIAIIENVGGLAKQTDFLRILVLMKEWDYETQHAILNSQDYGIPQHRKRIYIVGIHKSVVRKSDASFEFPPPKVDKRLTLMEILKLSKTYQLPCDETIDGEETMSKCFRDFYDAHRERLKEHVYIGLSSACRHKEVPASKEILPCLTTNCRSMYCIPEKRFATSAELLLFQGFDPSMFKVTVSKNQIAKQIGNAMTVNVLENIFLSIFKYVKL